jgi:hypothetical protein
MNQSNSEIKKGYTRILGYLVKVGSKRHSILVDTKRHLDDLRSSEMEAIKSNDNR